MMRVDLVIETLGQSLRRFTAPILCRLARKIWAAKEGA